MPMTPVAIYDEAAAERRWRELLKLLVETLGQGRQPRHGAAGFTAWAAASVIA